MTESTRHTEEVGPFGQWAETSSLVPWERNPRYNNHVVQQIAVSIQQFGFISPIVAQTGSRRIVSGHTRHKAALSLKLPNVPVVFVDLDDKRAEAYAIADNKLGELASWDDGLLSEILNDLDGSIDLESLGFSQYDLEEIMGDASSWEMEGDSDGFDPETLEDASTEKITVIVPLGEYNEVRKELVARFAASPSIRVE